MLVLIRARLVGTGGGGGVDFSCLKNDPKCSRSNSTSLIRPCSRLDVSLPFDACLPFSSVDLLNLISLLFSKVGISDPELSLTI